jgi:hypothetical protein
MEEVGFLSANWFPHDLWSHNCRYVWSDIQGLWHPDVVLALSMNTFQHIGCDHNVHHWMSEFQWFAWLFLAPKPPSPQCMLWLLSPNSYRSWFGGRCREYPRRGTIKSLKLNLLCLYRILAQLHSITDLHLLLTHSHLLSTGTAQYPLRQSSHSNHERRNQIKPVTIFYKSNMQMP